MHGWHRRPVHGDVTSGLKLVIVNPTRLVVSPIQEHRGSTMNSEVAMHRPPSQTSTHSESDSGTSPGIPVGVLHDHVGRYAPYIHLIIRLVGAALRVPTYP